ncbi:MAG: YkgJ family cysteine cluster protein [Dehalococcoidia bacterium]|nr:YkgJ family cysteine cluster protein [Dehalococcoidia bacterium]
MSTENSATTNNDFRAACFHCGECCTIHQALVEEHEIQRIADYLGISFEKLVSECTDRRWPIKGKFLLRHSGESGCIFLTQHNKEFLCSIHTVKPHPCSDWEAALSRKECRRGLSKVWGLTVDESCEICGTEHDKKAFTEHMHSIKA